MPGLKFLLLKNHSQWGLDNDTTLVETILREYNSLRYFKIDSIQYIDPLQFYCGSVNPEACDIAIHFEIPCRAALPWATKHIIIVNQEWWQNDEYEWVLNEPSFYFVFKSMYARSLFPTIDGKRCRIIHWRALPTIYVKTPLKREFLYLVGASVNKLKAAKQIVQAWNTTLPALTVVGTSEVIEKLKTCGGTGITFRELYKTKEERNNAQHTFLYHIVASTAEGFGFTAAEASTVGALPLWTNIPVYKEYYEPVLGSIGCINGKKGNCGDYKESQEFTFTETDVHQAVQQLLTLDPLKEEQLRGALKHAASRSATSFRQSWKTFLQVLTAKIVKPVVPPKALAKEELPHVAVVTLTYNRKKWWANMARNILEADYPHEKLTWIIADDSDSMERVDSDVLNFQSKYPSIYVKYLSLPKRLPIGMKRNKACSVAPSESSVFIMMDDDDHYPNRSISTRVSWLQRYKKECVYCSTLPMYDIQRYISAINCPPLHLAPEQRISEATLCFTRSFWQARKFPEPVNVAEGEAFLSGRIEETLEIPPNGIIVSFIHNGNTSSRRVPKETEANGSHYGFDDAYFTYLTQIGSN